MTEFLRILGKVVSGWKVSDNKDWSLIGKRSPQLPQMFYPISDSELTLTKGDIVAARCTMVRRIFQNSAVLPSLPIFHFQVNSHDHDVHIGTTGKDEMCNFYIMYWVKGKEPLDQRVCFSPGPPFWSWKRSARLQNIPDEEASTLY